MDEPQELGRYPVGSVVPGSSIPTTWELVRHAHSQALPHVTASELLEAGLSTPVKQSLQGILRHQ